MSLISRRRRSFCERSCSSAVVLATISSCVLANEFNRIFSNTMNLYIMWGAFAVVIKTSKRSHRQDQFRKKFKYKLL